MNHFEITIQKTEDGIEASTIYDGQRYVKLYESTSDPERNKAMHKGIINACLARLSIEESKKHGFTGKETEPNAEITKIWQDVKQNTKVIDKIINQQLWTKNI